MNTKTALILGGTSDIGRASAMQFAENGWDLVLTGRSKEYADRIAKDIQIRTGAKVDTLYFDVCDYWSHKIFYQSISPTPDLCIFAIGYLGSQEDAQVNWEESEHIINVNFKGAVSILNIIAEDFSRRKKGTIVGISSVAGDRGRQGNYIYGSAKAALTAYLSGLRNRLYKRGVHVITVKPGFVNTKMTEHLELPKLLTASPSKVAKDIFKAVIKKYNVVYVFGIWRVIIQIITLIPERLFKKTKL